MKSTSWSIVALIVLSQTAIFFGTRITLTSLDLNGEFYSQKNIVVKIDSVNREYSRSNSLYKRDSLLKAIRLNTLIDHTIPDDKDLSKTFLTLLTAVLVASITFADKIVGFSTARQWPKALLISSWISISIAIALCGLGLIFLMSAQNSALNLDKGWHNQVNPYYFANGFFKPEYFNHISASGKCYLHSGATFVIALIFMMSAGILAIKTNRPISNAETPGSVEVVK